MKAADSMWQVREQSGTLQRRRSFTRTLQWDPQLPADLVEEMWQSPSGLLADGMRLQEKTRCTIVRLDHPAGSFTWKYHTWGSAGRTVARSLSQSVSRKSWNDARFLHAAGVPTPQPRAFLERRVGPFQKDSFLLTDFVAGTSLYRLMRYECPVPEVVEQLARQVANIWQQLDELCVWHNDFKPENLLVDPAGKMWLIDFEKMRHLRDRATARRRQVRDAAMLLHPRNWRRAPWAADVFRQALLATPAVRETLAGPLGHEHPLSRAVPTVNRTSQLVTVLIPCAAGAEDLGQCIESVRDTADEIVVAADRPIDASSNAALHRVGCRVIWRECNDVLEFETWAHRQARHPWVLRILPGERVDAELSKRIQDVIAAESDADAYRIPRCATFCGRRLRHGATWHDAPIRLYRKDSIELTFRNEEMDVVARADRTGRLPTALSYELNSAPGDYVRSVVQRATAAALRDHRQGRQPSRVRGLARAARRFAHSYFLRRGWQDGWAGLHVACVNAGEAYLREATLWEMTRLGSPTIADSSVVRRAQAA